MEALSFEGPAAQRRREAILLLQCARTRPQPVALQKASEMLKQSIDWDYFIQEAYRHGIASLVFWNLSRLGTSQIPEEWLKQVQLAFSTIARWNLSLTGKLVELLNDFAQHEIRALPFKGPALAAYAYGNISLRQFCDLDILISREDFYRAKDLLQQRGYEVRKQLSIMEEQQHLRSHHDYEFVSRSDGAVIDIQWGVTERSFRFPIDFNQVWTDRSSNVMAGATICNISLEDLLLLLCVHGTKHQWGQLKWVCDIAELVDSYGEKADWRKLIRRARAQGGERMLLLGLLLSHSLLGAVLPENMLESIHSDSTVKKLGDTIACRLLSKQTSSDCNEPMRDYHAFFFWRVRERFNDKVAIAYRYSPEYLLMAVLPNRKDYALINLPRFLWLGYYLVRPIRLAWQTWTSFVRQGQSSRKKT
jgi:putative nucleotidyltransferase-like protein